MGEMFRDSKFNGDISNWNVSNVKNMSDMFSYSKFTSKKGDISKWDVSNVTDMTCMFLDSNFNADISNWNVSKVQDMTRMFEKCPLENNPPKWYKD
jgi:surface protein